MEGQQKWCDLMTWGFIPGRRALEATTMRYLSASHGTSFLYQVTNGHLHSAASSYASSSIWRQYCPNNHQGGSRFWLCLLAFYCLGRGATSKPMSFWHKFCLTYYLGDINHWGGEPSLTTDSRGGGLDLLSSSGSNFQSQIVNVSANGTINSIASLS